MTSNPLVGAVRGVGRTLFQAGTAFAADLANAGLRAAESVTGRSAAGPATLRLSVLVLSDESGTPLLHPAELEPAIAFADRVLHEQAGIRVRHVGTTVVTEPAATSDLDPRANKNLLLDQTLGRTAFYDRQMAADPNTGAVSDLVGRPITAIVVRSIAGRTTGCSLGLSADWVVVQSSLFQQADPHHYDETVLVHELGHACNLPHSRDRNNLMFPSSSPPGNLRGHALNKVQAAVLAGNRHVVPGADPV